MSSPEFYRGRKVLVTGGLGFIGSNLANRLVELGAKVTIVDSSVEGCGANPANLDGIAGCVDLMECDIGDTAQVQRALSPGTVIFNLAGEISHSMSMLDPERDLRLNTQSQLRFLLACREACPGARIVYAGTRQVYGAPEFLPVSEVHPIQPVDFNGVHKYAAAQYHILLARRGDLDCCVLRLTNVYGPRMALSLPQQGFLGVYLRQGLLGEPISVYGDGGQLRDPVYVDDVVESFLACGSVGALPSRVYNVGGPRALPLLEIARIVARVAAREGRQSEVRMTEFPSASKSIDIGSYATDSSRLQRQLGITARVEFEDGVRAALDYFRTHLDRYVMAAA